MATDDPMLTILGRLTVNFPYLIADVMVKYNLLADEAWWKLRNYIATNRKSLSAKFLKRLYCARYMTYWISNERNRVNVKETEIMDAIIQFYDSPAKFHLLYINRSTSSSFENKFCQDVVDGGLHRAMTEYLKGYQDGVIRTSWKQIFDDYIRIFHPFYYTATEEEWCLLLEQFLSEAEFPGILCDGVYHYRLYTNASLRALAKYNLLDTKIPIPYSHFITVSNLLCESVHLHYNAVMELLIELGATEKCQIISYRETQQRPMSEQSFESIGDLIRHYLRPRPEVVNGGAGGPVELVKRQKREHERKYFLETFSRYTALRRLPLLRFRHRHWEEYWKKVEATE
jgi:hypothetical protein